MLMKLTPIVNFANILQTAFRQYYFAIKLQSQSVIREKLQKALSYEKVSSKMFTKLTPYTPPRRCAPKKFNVLHTFTNIINF